MIIKTDDYIVDASTLNHCKISGSMRLPSPLSYDQPFSALKDSIETATEKLNVNITQLEFLNSSGITSLARLIILCRQLDKEIELTINKQIPWQNRSLSSLQHLWEKLTIESI